MFRPDNLLGPRSGVAPGSQTELDALAAVRADKYAAANHERPGVIPEAYGLGESALSGALDEEVKVTDMRRAIEREDALRTQDGSIDLPQVHDPAALHEDNQ